MPKIYHCKISKHILLELYLIVHKNQRANSVDPNEMANHEPLNKALSCIFVFAT